LLIGFDIHGLDQNAKEDQEGIEKASKLCKIVFFEFHSFFLFILLFTVKDLVEDEIKNGIPPERIVSKYDLENFLICLILF